MGTRLIRIGSGRALPLVAVFLLGVRFAAPSVTAAMGVQGVDTSAFGLFFPAYDVLVAAVAALLVGVLVVTWPGTFGWDAWLVVALGSVIASIVAWAGEADPAYRLVSGPWATLPLTFAVTAAILAFGVVLDLRVGWMGRPAIRRSAFRALYIGFALVYLVGALRFIDYAYTLGTPLPSGLLWLLNYAPTLVPCLVAIYFWLVLAAAPAPSASRMIRFMGPPLLGAAVGVVVSQGLGGFILSNALAWGGAYEVFVPTALSLAVVGFAVGSFLATAWLLRGRLPAPAWLLLVSGVAVTALAGIVFFEGALASLAGILLGVTLAARGFLALEAVQPPGIPFARP